MATLLGCQFNPQGQGGGHGIPVDDSTDDDPSATTEASPTTTASSAPDDTSEPTSAGEGSALLVISDAPMLDFGPVMVGATDDRVLTVTNLGDTAAAGLAGAPIGGGFDYAGGAFPGDAGTCGPSLGAGQACEVALRFAPGTLGQHLATFTVTYDGGAEATRPVTGGGTGKSGNLLVNPGGEQGGNDPPLGWTSDGVGRWLTGAWVTPREGSLFIGSDVAPDGVEIWLFQDVAIADAWVPLVEGSLLRFVLSGYARNYGLGDDVYRIRVRYRDGAGVDLDEWDSGWLTSDTWQPLDDSRVAPPATRVVRVQLGCLRSGGTYCDAYYDALDLQAAYP
jgi:hypothetical protein